MGGKVTVATSAFGSIFDGYQQALAQSSTASQMQNVAMNLQLSRAYQSQQQATNMAQQQASMMNMQADINMQLSREALMRNYRPVQAAPSPRPRVEVSAEDRKDFEADEMLRKAKEQGERLEAQFWHSVSTAR